MIFAETVEVKEEFCQNLVSLVTISRRFRNLWVCLYLLGFLGARAGGGFCERKHLKLSLVWEGRDKYLFLIFIF